MLLLLVACAGDATDDKAPLDDSVAADSPRDDSAPTDDSPTDSPDPTGSAPTLTDCDASCWEHQTGDVFYQWLVECHATDPEGLESIANGRLEIQRSGAVEGTALVACDRAGYCSTSFRETDFDVLCRDASSYSFHVWVSDLEGHESEPFVVIGRER